MSDDHEDDSGPRQDMERSLMATADDDITLEYALSIADCYALSTRQTIALRAELARLRQNDNRYAWLRTQCCGQDECCLILDDAAIDAAMTAEKGKS